MSANQILYGSGIIPAAGDLSDQLTATTRRGMAAIAVDQYSNATPLLAMLTANANVASGGVSSITVPAKFGSALSAQSSDFSGKFNLPTDTPTITNGIWNFKFMIMPIQMYGVELAVQDEHAVIDLMASRFDDVGQTMAQYDTTALYTNVTDNQQILGLPAAIDDGTNLVTYAGISRNTQTKWKAYYRSVTTGTYPTRANLLQYIIGVNKNAGGDMPTACVCGANTWLALQQDFQGLEIMNRSPGNYMGKDDANSGFLALSLMGIPIFSDVSCPEGDVWILNDNYLNLYVHRRLGFAMSPFQSMMSNGQYAYLGAVMSMRELVCAKPSAQGHIANFSYISV